jgi:hypothetical protein
MVSWAGELFRRSMGDETFEPEIAAISMTEGLDGWLPPGTGE